MKRQRLVQGSLAGVVLLGAALYIVGSLIGPGYVQAAGRPEMLLCEFGDGKKGLAIPIDWKGGGMGEAVSSCLDMGGHPAGVDRGSDSETEETK